MEIKGLVRQEADAVCERGHAGGGQAVAAGQPVRGYLAFFRVRDWYYIVGIALLGYAYRLPLFDPVQLVGTVGVAALYLAHGYGFNHYFDLRHESREPAPALAGVDLRLGLVLSLVLLGLCLAGAAALSWSAAAALAAGGLVSVLYSSSLTRLKRRPICNVVLNSTGFMVLFLAGHLVHATAPGRALAMAGYLWLGIVPFQIIHLVAHQREEGTWRLGPGVSAAAFQLSQLVWVGYAIAMAVALGRELVPLAMLTTAYVVLQALLVVRQRDRGGLTADGATRVRARIKLASIAFGGLVLLLFVTGWSP